MSNMSNFRLIDLVMVFVPWIIIAILLFALFKTKKENKIIKMGTKTLLWSNIILFAFPMMILTLSCRGYGCGTEGIGLLMLFILGLIITTYAYIITVIGLCLKSDFPVTKQR